uniref:Uncharacterized protein n=1 Tax=Trypanosoma congolense (strain IL3000) TaxID=1068625 RepID=G0V039_TRYCI|nr:conserved hypothetical protein [Trypanosoma congolense IL3000]
MRASQKILRSASRISGVVLPWRARPQYISESSDREWTLLQWTLSTIVWPKPGELMETVAHLHCRHAIHDVEDPIAALQRKRYLEERRMMNQARARRDRKHSKKGENAKKAVESRGKMIGETKKPVSRAADTPESPQKREKRSTRKIPAGEGKAPPLVEEGGKLSGTTRGTKYPCVVTPQPPKGKEGGSERPRVGSGREGTGSNSSRRKAEAIGNAAVCDPPELVVNSSIVDGRDTNLPRSGGRCGKRD